MKGEQIVRLFLENGFQLSKSALSIISNNPEEIIFELKKIKPKPFLVTEEHVKKILKDINFRAVKFRLIKDFTINKKKLHVNDYIEHLLSRYEKIKSILIKQMSPEKLVSINKITSRTTKFSIIGLVKKKNYNSLLVEDPTSEINVYFDENKKKEFDSIFLDDILALQCEKKEEKFYVKKIIYPDVLSTTVVAKSKEEMLIAFVVSIQDLTNEQTKKLIDCLSEIKNLSKIFVFNPKNLSKLTKPPQLNFIEIPTTPTPKLFQLDLIKILIIPSSFFNHYLESPETSELFTSMLKRRELIVGNCQIYNIHDDFILDEIPDIVLSDFSHSVNLNYKGITIISNSNPKKVFTVNLKTREVEEISL